MIVYMATNKVNGKMYIGQTVGNLGVRKRNHINDALNKSNTMYFGKAIRKYNQDNFDWEVLDSARNIDELNELEIFFIKLFKTFGEGYNLNAGGKNALHSEETKRKMSEAQKGEKCYMYGKKGKNSVNWGRCASVEVRKHMSEAQKGIKCSEESKQKISKTLKGRKLSKEHIKNITRKGKDHPMYGKHHSESSKKRVSKSRTGKYTGKNNHASRAVIVNGKHFDTIVEASKFIGMSASVVSIRLKNKVPGYEYACKKEN